ncbi:MAG: hypothetical protein LVS60_00715 [Nodosilinea sp. LVE1205-7]
MDKSIVYWFDGQIHSGTHLAVAWDDPALIYGATVFTTLRVYAKDLDHPLTAWVAHQERLSQTLKSFGWPQPIGHRLRRGAEQLKGQFPILRLTCWPDGRELITGQSLPPESGPDSAPGNYGLGSRRLSLSAIATRSQNRQLFK